MAFCTAAPTDGPRSCRGHEARTPHPSHHPPWPGTSGVTGTLCWTPWTCSCCGTVPAGAPAVLLEALLACTGDRCKGRRHGALSGAPGPARNLSQEGCLRDLFGAGLGGVRGPVPPPRLVTGHIQMPSPCCNPRQGWGSSQRCWQGEPILPKRMTRRSLASAQGPPAASTVRATAALR